MADHERPQPSSRARKIPAGRLDEVEKLILQVESTSTIERDLSALWGISRRHVRRYVSIVRRRLGERAKSSTPEADAAQVREMLESAYRVASAGRDAKGMVAAARTLAEVTGVAAPRKVDITSGGQPVQVYIPAEREP